MPQLTDQNRPVSSEDALVRFYSVFTPIHATREDAYADTERFSASVKNDMQTIEQTRSRGEEKVMREGY